MSADERHLRSAREVRRESSNLAGADRDNLFSSTTNRLERDGVDLRVLCITEAVAVAEA